MQCINIIIIFILSSLTIQNCVDALTDTLLSSTSKINDNNFQGKINLAELQENYEIAYPKFFSFIRNINTSVLPNVNRLKHPSRCSKRTVLSKKQHQHLDNLYGTHYVFNSTIEEIINITRFRLFTGRFLTGKSEDYHLWFLDDNKFWCFRVNLFEVKSVENYGHCIRLFSDQLCKGLSIAIYPGSTRSLILEMNTVQSVGPCLTEEFLPSASTLDYHKRVIRKNPNSRDFFPDLNEFFSTEKFENGRLLNATSTNGVLFHYLWGPNYRLEFVVAGVNPDNFAYGQTGGIHGGNVSSTISGSDSDAVSLLAIPPFLGGPLEEASYNQILVNRSCARDWYEIGRKILRMGGRWMSIALNFEYENLGDSSPRSFYYYIFLDKTWPGDYLYLYGRVLNDDGSTNPKIATNRSSPGPGIDLKKVSDYLRNFTETRPNPFRPNSSTLLNINTLACGLKDTSCASNLTPRGSMQINLTIEAMVNHPLGRFFTGENFTGDFEDFSFKTSSEASGNCFNLQKVQGRITSVVTFGKCIRLFYTNSCLGFSLAIYQKNGFDPKILFSELLLFSSIGPCLHDEFQSASFSDQSKGHILKERVSKTFFPDLVEFFSLMKARGAMQNSDGSSLAYYSMGQNGRTEFLWANITLNHVNPYWFINGQNVSVANDLGVLHGIPKILGGTDSIYNVFNASSTSVKKWTETISVIPRRIKTSKDFIWLALNFAYDNDENVQPNSFYYSIVQFHRFVSYGRVLMEIEE